MYEALVRESTLSEAYHRALVTLELSGEKAECQDWNTIQKEVSMTMVVWNPTSEPRISRLFIGGPKELEQYCQEMLDGILDFEIERGNWDYTYHDRMTNYPVKMGRTNQIAFVIKELERNPSSRRAVIVIRDPSVDMKSNDPACLQHIQYFIRNGKLHCKVLFRSNDACKAAFMNAFALIRLQEKIADILEIPVGTYTHRANSFHCYEKDFGMLKGYVDRIFSAKSKDDLTYDFKDDCEYEMEDCRDEIAEQVKILKDRK